MTTRNSYSISRSPSAHTLLKDIYHRSFQATNQFRFQLRSSTVGRSCETLLGEKSRNKARECFPRSSPLHLRQRRLRLRQPEGHVHTSVHFNSRRQLCTS